MTACWRDLWNASFHVSQVALIWHICSKLANKHGQHKHQTFSPTLYSLLDKVQPGNCVILQCSFSAIENAVFHLCPAVHHWLMCSFKWAYAYHACIMSLLWEVEINLFPTWPLLWLNALAFTYFRTHLRNLAAWLDWFNFRRKIQTQHFLTACMCAKVINTFN